MPTTPAPPTPPALPRIDTALVRAPAISAYACAQMERYLRRHEPALYVERLANSGTDVEAVAVWLVVGEPAYLAWVVEGSSEVDVGCDHGITSVDSELVRAIGTEAGAMFLEVEDEDGQSGGLVWSGPLRAMQALMALRASGLSADADGQFCDDDDNAA